MGTQVLFLIVLNNVLTTPNLDSDDAEDFRIWRRQSAHVRSRQDSNPG